MLLDDESLCKIRICLHREKLLQKFQFKSFNGYSHIKHVYKYSVKFLQGGGHLQHRLRKMTYRKYVLLFPIVNCWSYWYIWKETWKQDLFAISAISDVIWAEISCISNTHIQWRRQYRYISITRMDFCADETLVFWRSTLTSQHESQHFS